jgi:hypothetical protein
MQVPQHRYMTVQSIKARYWVEGNHSLTVPLLYGGRSCPER